MRMDRIGRGSQQYKVAKRVIDDFLDSRSVFDTVYQIFNPISKLQSWKKIQNISTKQNIIELEE